MKSILISNLNNLGDVVCSTAAMELLKANFPGLRLGLIVRADAAGGIRGNSLVDELYLYDYQSGSVRGNFWRLLRDIRRRRYETFLTLDRKSRSLLVAYLAGIPRRISPTSMHWLSKPRWYLPYLANTMVDYTLASPYDSLQGMFEEPIRRAFALSGKGKISMPPLPPEAIARARELLRPAGKRPVVGFSVRANSPLKNWLPERFAQVMDRIEEQFGAYIVVTGATNDREYIDALLSLRKKGSAVNLAGETSILEMVAVSVLADLFVTLDTGTLHLTANSGVRNLLCIFGCTSPSVVQESLDAANAVSFWAGEKCCFEPPCAYPLEQSPCRVGIGVDEVFAAAAKILAKDTREAVTVDNHL